MIGCDEEEEVLVDDGTVPKKRCNVVFIGHVDSGKSTTSGRILSLTGNIDERALEKNARDAKMKGMESYEWAFPLDELEEERDRGKTWECGHATFETAQKIWSIIDGPGHRQFIPNMISGASLADVAVLIISAKRGEFESGFDKDGQTKEHILLAKTVGISNLIVGVNKMDEATVMWSEERYNEIKGKLVGPLKSMGWTDVAFVPISGFVGVNLKDRVSEAVCPWYSGGSLLDVLDNIRPPTRHLSHPLVLPIQDKYRARGVTSVLGKVEAGTVQMGD